MFKYVQYQFCLDMSNCAISNTIKKKDSSGFVNNGK